MKYKSSDLKILIELIHPINKMFYKYDKVTSVDKILNYELEIRNFQTFADLLKTKLRISKEQ